jgi:hypothetical protein
MTDAPAPITATDRALIAHAVAFVLCPSPRAGNG